MRHRYVRAALLVVLGLAFAYPVAAGGWATVRLDEEPQVVVAGEPWRFGFIVKQHDRTPTNDVEPLVRAVHMQTGMKLDVTGTQVGDVGHFEAEVTFPTAGDWKWEIVPAPFPGTSMETLTVLTGDKAAALSEEFATKIAPMRGFRITFTIDIGPIPAQTARVTPPAESAAVAIEEMSFSPSRIEIASGTEVVWTNTAFIAHSVMSNDLAFRDSGLLDQADEFRQVFTEPGIYTYWCGPHPTMTGTIVVTE
jgi:plastocyanin